MCSIPRWRGAHVGGRGEAVAEQEFLRLGKGLVALAGVGGGIFSTSCHRRIDEQAILDPPAGRRLGLPP